MLILLGAWPEGLQESETLRAAMDFAADTSSRAAQAVMLPALGRRSTLENYLVPALGADFFAGRPRCTGVGVLLCFRDMLEDACEVVEHVLALASGKDKLEEASSSPAAHAAEPIEGSAARSRRRRSPMWMSDLPSQPTITNAMNLN